MSWHVRYFSPALDQDLLTPEMASRNDALEEAWNLTESGEHVTAVEGPDGELLSADAIELWYAERYDQSAAASKDKGAAEGAASWRLITRDADGHERTSEAFETRDGALDHACTLQRAGTSVVVITSSEGDALVAEEISEWCKLRGDGEGDR